MKEFFARLNPTERRFVVAVGVLFFLVLNSVFIWPHFGDWGKNRARLKDARDKLGLFQAGIANTPTLERDIRKYQQGGGASVPLDNQISSFFRLIQNQAARSRVGIISMAAGRQQQGANQFFVEQNQTVNLQAGETNLVNFLYDLGADSNSLIRVRDLSVQPDAPHQNLNARVTLIASYQKTAPGARAAGSTAPAPAPAPKTVASPPGQKPVSPSPAVKPNTPPAPGPKTPAPGPAGAQKPLPPKPGFPGFPGRALGSNAPNPLTPNKK